MNRKGKIEFLTGLRRGVRSIYELNLPKCIIKTTVEIWDVDPADSAMVMELTSGIKVKRSEWESFLHNRPGKCEHVVIIKSPYISEMIAKNND